MRPFIKRIITGFILSSSFFFVYLCLPPFYSSLILFGILLHIMIYEWKNLFNMCESTFWLLMPLYPILPFAMLIHMNHDPTHRVLLFILFILISSFDTGSYIAGILFGKHIIAPSISPGKTWEGVVGGYGAACISLTLVLWELNVIKPWWFIMLFTLVISMLGLSGDLFESWLKRRARIKDSGSILPGHGGFLDRFDGILFATFFFFLSP